MTVLTVIRPLAKEVILFPDTGSRGLSVQRLERSRSVSWLGKRKGKVQDHPHI